MKLDLDWRTEADQRLPVALWHPGPGYRMISTGVLGGGLGPREWVLNAQVPSGYARTDPAEHLGELARALGLTGPGIGLLTAAQVTDLVQRQDEGVQAAATVGLSIPTWAAAPPGRPDLEPARPGTINTIVALPVPLTDAAFVNAVVTATEAKAQAVLAAGFAATGTASDAICVAAPAGPDREEEFAGPRSLWGARIARAVHAAVYAGAVAYAGRTR